MTAPRCNSADRGFFTGSRWPTRHVAAVAYRALARDCNCADAVVAFPTMKGLTACHGNFLPSRLIDQLHAKSRRQQ